MKYLIHLLIRFYQKFISPHKGFRCAHAKRHGGDSCSEAVRKIVLGYGLFYGYVHVQKRFRDCTLAYHQLMEQQDKNDNNKQNKPPGRCRRHYQDNKNRCLECGGEGCGQGCAELPCNALSKVAKCDLNLLCGLDF